MVGLMVTSSKRAYAIPKSAAPSHTRVCCSQSPCSYGSSLLTCTSTGDTQTQFCLSLCGVPRSWYTQGWFELSERLWREWGLILNVNLPLPLSCWGFSFALGCGVSPHGRSSKAQPLLLTLDVGYLLTATAPNFGHGVSPHSRHS